MLPLDIIGILINALSLLISIILRFYVNYLRYLIPEETMESIRKKEHDHIFFSLSKLIKKINKGKINLEDYESQRRIIEYYHNVVKDFGRMEDAIDELYMSVNNILKTSMVGLGVFLILSISSGLLYYLSVNFMASYITLTLSVCFASVFFTVIYVQKKYFFNTREKFEKIHENTIFFLRRTFYESE